MLCQYCERNEATTHIKRVVNGEMTQTHLCADCAAHLGYGDVFSGFSLNLGELLGGFTNAALHSAGEAKVLRCPKCGNSFEDIAREGKLGCAECYAAFYDKLLPSLQRLHGLIQHSGKVAYSDGEKIKLKGRIDKLKTDLAAAVAEQNFELAAELRDEIKALEKEQDAGVQEGE